jgi:23S rRNA (uracil1939-C5)-methyltransferase
MVAPSTREQRLLRIDLAGMGRLGEALAEVDGKQVFVFGGIPGESVVAEVLREQRSYIAARVVKVVEPSPYRVAAPCHYFGQCTGCQWQHISYAYQLELKRGIVRDALERVGGLQNVTVPETVPSPQPWGYRNHARFTVSPDGAGRLGYVNRSTRQWVGVETCMLMAPWINKALAALQGHVEETTQLSLRYGVNTGSWILQPRLYSPTVPMESGQKHYQESLLGTNFQVSSPSFFQVNTLQAEKMMELVYEGLALTGSEIVVDAYAGVGTFAVLLAGKARRVIAIEESASALEDAKHNISGTPNVEFRRGKTEQVLAELAREGLNVGVQLDAVVLDPPRAGCQPEALDALLAATPRRVVYVSCDPETLARDLKVLTDGPYRIECVQPVDMFPHTHHVECITTLVFDAERQVQLAARQRIVLASASPRRREILSRLGLEYVLAPSDVDEPPGQADGEDPVALSTARALAKAQSVAAHQSSGTVIGADTVVTLDDAVLGKPRDTAEAIRMLRALRGREHRVVTAIALVDAATGQIVEGHRSSRVVMRDYTDGELEAYVASGDPMDKAGAYAVQSEAFHPSAEVRGCYLNVVGLPVCTLLKLLDRFRVTAAITSNMGSDLERCPECAERVARSRQRLRLAGAPATFRGTNEPLRTRESL